MTSSRGPRDEGVRRVRVEGATELLTSFVPGGDGPAGFYERLGFVPTGELDDSGEVIMRLGLRGYRR